MRPYVLALSVLWLPAQEVLPVRGEPAEYKAHARLGPQFTLAAEFLGRTVPAPEMPFVLQHHVVVEVAIFTGPFTFNTGEFSLRLNNKLALVAEAPGMVAASLKYANWENQPQMTATASAGNAGIILGRRDTDSRFPGDRRPPRPPAGTATQVEVAENAPRDWVTRLAWQEGPGKGPASGLLYFPYKGNLAKLKTIELLYQRPEGLTVLVLRGGPPSAATSVPPGSTGSPAKSGAPEKKP